MSQSVTDRRSMYMMAFVSAIARHIEDTILPLPTWIGIDDMSPNVLTYFPTAAFRERLIAVQFNGIPEASFDDDDNTNKTIDISADCRIYFDTNWEKAEEREVLVNIANMISNCIDDTRRLTDANGQVWTDLTAGRLRPFQIFADTGSYGGVLTLSARSQIRFGV